LKRIILKPGKEQSVKRFHPWVFSGAIDRVSETPAEGEYLAVYSCDNVCLGTGHYHSGSIAIRMIEFSYSDPSSGFWKMKFEKALRLRVISGLFGKGHTNVFRLVNAEGDGFPGLIVDYYDGWVVMQAHSVGMCKISGQLAIVLKDLLGDNLNGIYDKTSPALKEKSGVSRESDHLLGDKKHAIVHEYGNKFRVNWVEGQKTGFFIDQRENRKLLEHYSCGKTVLNMFGYTGGFSVYAMRGGALKVTTVDSSKKAIGLADENIALNFPGDSRHESFGSEVFDYFRENNNRYDIIVIDPPAFAKSRKAQNNAIQAYKRLNAKALEHIVSGGILFTFSCSQVIGRQEFRQAVYSAALETGREAKIMHSLSHPPDHPFSIFHPEGEYLKGLVLQVS
jgi:23S rRNA (cytosine1962-C5)-methyltransferase